jgi:hypothetical protein
MEIPRHWRLKKQRYNLEGNLCNVCDAKIFPPREICPECGKDTQPTPVSAVNREIYSSAESLQPAVAIKIGL